MAEENYKCIRKCFHYAGPGLDEKGNPQSPMRLYQFGEPLAEGAPVNRHFAIDGIVPKDNGPEPLRGMGDDKRSTKQMIKDIKEKYGVKFSATAKRKDVFAKWVDKEIEAAAAVEAKEQEDAKLLAELDADEKEKKLEKAKGVKK